MMNVNEEFLSVSSDQFEDFRSSFDALLNDLVTTMIATGSEDGKINVMLEVSIEECVVNGVTVRKPTFRHTVSTVVQTKHKLTGSSCGEYELVYDPNVLHYVLKPIDNGQMSLGDFADEGYEYDEPLKSS